MKGISSTQLGHARTVVYGLLFVAISLTAGLAYLSPKLQPAADAGWSIADAAQSTDIFRLSIPKIDVSAPVIADVDGTNEREYLQAIENGVAQMEGTSKPDAPGNTFIFGHSSYYATKPGNFKEVFKRLNELQPGDPLTVQYQTTSYAYEVTESKIVSDADWSILKPSENADEKTVTLMTCWPPGTLQKRYVVVAKQTAAKNSVE